MRDSAIYLNSENVKHIAFGFLHVIFWFPIIRIDAFFFDARNFDCGIFLLLFSHKCSCKFFRFLLKIRIRRVCISHGKGVITVHLLKEVSHEIKRC